MLDSSPAPEATPASDPGTDVSTPESKPVDSGYHSMTEEMDSAKWRLPPALPVLIAGLGVAIIVTIFALVMGRPLGTGQILGVTSAEQATKDSVLVALKVSVKNTSDKALIIKSISAEMTPASDAKDQSVLQDDAAPAVDYARYFQAYPVLADKMEPLRPDTTLQPGETQEGMVVVGFPVDQAGFEKRKSLRVLLTLYEHANPIKIQQ